MSALSIGQRTVLQALEKGALLYVDEGTEGRRLGHYLSWGPGEECPIRADLFAAMDRAGLIAPTLSGRKPVRWRATDKGRAVLSSLGGPLS